MIAAIYLRSATTNDNSIAEQLQICTEHAHVQGWDIGDVFIDNGISGVRADRPGFNELRSCVREGRAAVIIASGPDRFSRDLEQIYEFKSWCDELEVKISCSPPYEAFNREFVRLLKNS